MCCGLVRPSARCNWCFSLWLKVEDEIFHLHHFIPSLPSLHPPILFSYSLCHPPPPSNQGLGSYCPLLMLSNGVFFRCCQTVLLSKFVIDHNSYWFLGSDCHCTSLFHASFLLKSYLFFHTSLLLKSFSYKFFARVLVPFSVKTRFEQQSFFSPLLQQQQRFLFHPISLVMISLNIVSWFDRISPCNMYQHDWRSGMKTGFAYVCPWIVTVINNKNECHQQHLNVKQSWNKYLSI